MVDREEAGNVAQSLEVRLAARVEAIRAAANGSPQRQQLLQLLLSEILQSGRLGRPQSAVWPLNLYQDLYNEALQQALLDVCQMIDHYNPEHPVMAWVNFRLNCRFMEVVKDYQKQGITQMPKAERAFPVRLPCLDDLPLAIPTPAIDLSIQQFLRQDPEGRLQKCLRDRPEITFQNLAIAKFIEGKSWATVAQELNVSIQTLCSFFNRQLRDLIPYFQQYLDP